MHDHDHHDHSDEGGGGSALIAELRAHVPFSVSAVTIGLIVAGAICIQGYRSQAPGSQGTQAPAHEQHMAGDHPDDHDHEHQETFAELFFHLFHPAHMLFSAAATTAMFRRYERKAGKAIVVGLVGAIGVCGVSDIAIPQFSLLLLGTHTPWHICVIEHPELALPFAGIGVFMGLWAPRDVLSSTLISHSLHVFVSTMASIFYMVAALGAVAWIGSIGSVFMLVVAAVLVPCCVSDIIFPMLMSRAGRARYAEVPHTH